MLSLLPTSRGHPRVFAAALLMLKGKVSFAEEASPEDYLARL